MFNQEHVSIAVQASDIDTHEPQEFLEFDNETGRGSDMNSRSCFTVGINSLIL